MKRCRENSVLGEEEEEEGGGEVRLLRSTQRIGQLDEGEKGEKEKRETSGD